MDRRVFIIEAGKAFPILAGALYFVRCGSETTTIGASGTIAGGEKPTVVVDIQSQSTVVNGHSHSLMVPASDQLHPADVTYTTSNAAAHTHEVILLTAQLQTLAAGGSVIVSTTAEAETGIHKHQYKLEGKKA